MNWPLAPAHHNRAFAFGNFCYALLGLSGISALKFGVNPSFRLFFSHTFWLKFAFRGWLMKAIIQIWL
jgi:hypothetical protein